MLTIRTQQLQQLGAVEQNRRNVQPCRDTQTWIALQLLDQDQKALAGARYRVVLPDQSVFEGSLSDDGSARIEGITPGECSITFPEIDGREWQPLAPAA